MKCSIMLHFICVFTVCQSTGLWVSGLQMGHLAYLRTLYLKGTYQGFSFFIANSFYMSDLMYLLRTQIIFHNVQ